MPMARFRQQEERGSRCLPGRYYGIGTLTCVLLCLVALIGGRAPAAEDSRILLRVSSLSVPKTPWHEMWQRFEARINQGAQGFETRMFIAGELGSEETALANIRRGRVQIGGFSLQGLATVVPELSLLLTPYLFDSRAEVDFVVDHYLDQAYRDLLAEKGLELLQWSEVGWTSIYSTRPVRQPEDARGLSMRASNALGSRVFAEAIGADLIPVTFSELIPAMQTGLIESAQGGVGMYTIAGISREAPYLTLTRHAFDAGLIVANREWYRSLSQDQQQLVASSMDRRQDGREAIRQMLDGFYADLPNRGVTILEPDAELGERWRAAARDSHLAMIQAIGGRAEEIFELVQQGKSEFIRRQASSGSDAG